MLAQLQGRLRAGPGVESPGVESPGERRFRSLLPRLRQLLLQPALQCAAGFDAPFQLCPQSLDLCQQTLQVTEGVLPPLAISCCLCEHVQKETLASSTTRVINKGVLHCF